MPLRFVDFPSDPNSLKSVPGDYLVIYSSLTDGKLWCPDCVAVDDTVQSVFGNNDGPSALIVYVGQKADWKTPSNQFRGEPWKIQSVPTIIRLRDDARLVDMDIIHRLHGFVEDGFNLTGN
ncbi:hypothetical protein SERLA73DRAFT_183803 [Serpula lacrymans var. lacrymans S7.3]|uniref:Thioredoxin domain-containing protein n=2 Tax=Serpula lacrymans var. lacrymans TaxID=341189 RepID=F8Q1V3_SERL3|nr:uncharacterized protein SERLADRAFT_471177 [Serpula lacrymans var. lacrymans S7.9]EGN97164.1 hypothetical protein SERLA73DRAFT_183803 [Serpula lacrymans var. lacrymans S7.3]EGO22772.1 hypothetical protein SERLADRAFT_471177 [Serpula lacrymans var. lacrymans S7.9]